jgi:hypothetical protein
MYGVMHWTESLHNNFSKESEENQEDRRENRYDQEYDAVASSRVTLRIHPP